METKQEPKGAFVESLRRNNKAIRDDRAEAIHEDAEIVYKRKVEDMRIELKRLNRSREQMLDLSPSNAMSLMLAEDFDAGKFVDLDIDFGVKMREIEIKLEIAERQYTHLFGGN